MFNHDYFAVVKKNLGVTLAYSSLLVAGGMYLAGEQDPEMQKSAKDLLWAGTVTLSYTMGGLQTLRALRRTRAHIQKKGTLDERFQHEYERWYCSAVGCKMAAVEQGVSEQLTQNIKSKSGIPGLISDGWLVVWLYASTLL